MSRSLLAAILWLLMVDLALAQSGTNGIQGNNCVYASATLLGCIKPDGTTVSVSGTGVLSAITGAAGINQLTGDVTAGPGVGSQAATVAKIQGTTVSGTTGSGNAVFSVGAALTGLTGLAIRDTSAAFDVTLAAASSVALTAGRTLTLDTVNVAHTLAFNATANTITFPNTASYTLIGSQDSGTVTNTMLAGSIAASKLVGTDIATVGALTSGSIASGFGAIATANTITTSNSTASTSGSTGAITSGGGIGAAGALWAGTFIGVSGTTLPTQAAGTLGIGGEAATPTTGSNGMADIWISSTTNGLTLQGRGSSQDITINNGAGGTVCNIATGASGITCGFVNVTSSSVPTNGVYLPAASTLGLVGTTAIELFGGGGNKMDYAVTTAGTWTLGAATTINSATFKVTTLAASTAIDTVCYTTATGLFTEEPTGTTCTVSDERKKTAMQPISRRHSLDIVLGSRPISYFYKPEMGDPDYHLGFGAQTLAKVAPELVQRDQDGVPNAVKQLELLPITWAAMQQQQQQLNAQGRQIAELKQALGLRK